MADSEAPRIIAGFGRSGTTWVQDVLATANSLRAVFEPLHPDVNIDAAPHAHAYHNADDADPELYSFLCKYLYDDFHSMWVDYRIRADLLIPRADDLRSWQHAKRKLRRIARSKDNYLRYRSQRRHNARITKLVRANMMLPWLQKSFDARIVFLIRHPVAVVMSQMSCPEVWKPFARIDRYKADSVLLDALHKNTRELVLGQLDEVEAFSLSWHPGHLPLRYFPHAPQYSPQRAMRFGSATIGFMIRSPGTSQFGFWSVVQRNGFLGARILGGTLTRFDSR